MVFKVTGNSPPNHVSGFYRLQPSLFDFTQKVQRFDSIFSPSGGFVLALSRNWEEKKRYFIKHKEIRRDTPTSGPQPPVCPVEMSRLSRGLRTPRPIYVELQINQVGTSRMSRDSPPKPSPGHFRGPRHTDHQIHLCALCSSVFSSPPKTQVQNRTSA